jgi:hypothetical protein
VDRLKADLEALAGIERGSASEGEQTAARWAAGRLTECGASQVGIEHYRGRTTNSWSFAGHSAVGLLAQILGGIGGALLALGALVSLERDASGRSPWRRRIAGGAQGANAIATVAPTGERLQTVVIVAHLDAARTGLAWHPRITQSGAKRHLRTRKVEPVIALQGIALAGSALAALLKRGSFLRRVIGVPAALLNLLAVLANLDIARSASVPGANDNASGVAAALSLAESLSASPLRSTQVEFALVGSEESGMGGFHAFLENRAGQLDPKTTLVLGLDTLGSGTPIVAAAEGALMTHRYGEDDLALADEGARLAGQPVPQRWRIGGWTDPLLALTRGIPAISLLSIGPGYYPHYHDPSDLPEFVDFDCLTNCTEIAAGILRSYDEAASVR